MIWVGYHEDHKWYLLLSPDGTTNQDSLQQDSLQKKEFTTIGHIKGLFNVKPEWLSSRV